MSLEFCHGFVLSDTTFAISGTIVRPRPLSAQDLRWNAKTFPHTLLAMYKCALCDFVLASLVHAYRQFSLKLSKALCRIIVPRFRSLFRLCFRVQNLKRDASLFALVRFCPQKPVETRERHRGT